MKLKIEMKMDNAAFDEGFKNIEAARILHEFAYKLCNSYDLGPEDTFVGHDLNGDTVLHAEVTE